MRDGFNQQIRLQFGRVTLRTRAAARYRLPGRADVPPIFLRDVMNRAHEIIDTGEIWLAALDVRSAMTADPK